MIKNIRLIQFFFRRGKHRREHIPLDDKLKDLTSAQTFQKQIEQHRKKFESRIPEQTLTQTLSQQKPKLSERFKVNREELQKNIRREIKKQLKIQRIVPGAQGQEFKNLQSKSHIYDQRAEIQFEQKFRKELFKKRQTNRLLQKQKNDFRNYLEQPKNEAFVQYQENLNKLKNSKIESMMNFKRNNDQLRFLIDSGYIDNPDNLAIILDNLNSDRFILQHEKSEGNMIVQSDSLQTAQNLNQNQLMQSTSLSPVQQTKQISPEVQQLHEKMLRNIQGPSQLRNPKLLQQFFQNLKQSTEVQKQKAKQDLQLMKSIKQFESITFENRYNTLNFRFKGQVNFDWMKQSQLLSYIKTQKNIDTQPQGLLTMYSQNKNKQNKFNQPIITPTVMSRIYSVCSLYEFPQTDQNNKINMLNDSKFVDLEKSLFRNVHQLSDQSFADAVFAYCRNHKEEQGLLRVKMSEKVLETIWKQISERVNSLQEEDLGLILRSILNTSMLRNQNFDWTLIVEALNERLPLMEKDYEFESVMSFLTLVPVSESSISAVYENIPKYRSYKWSSKQTLQSYLQVSSFLIRYKEHFPGQKGTKMIQELKYLFSSKYQEIMPITQQLSINTMPQLLSMIYTFEKSKQLEAIYEIEIPNKLINKCKKEVIDNLRMQKELIKKHTVGNITMSMALIDYSKALSSSISTRETELPALQSSTLKSLFTFRPIPFNSINYFTYHELIKLVNSQIAHLPVKSIAQTLFASSLVRYKNEGLIQQVMGKIVQKIHFETKQSGQDEKLAHLKYTKQYALMVCTFHHCRMVNSYYYHFIDLLMQAPASSLVKLQPNLQIRFFEAITSLSFTTDERYIEDFLVTNHFAKVFEICYEQTFRNCLSALTKEELLVLEYIASAFCYFNRKSQGSQTDTKKYLEIQSHVVKFNNKLSTQEKYLRGMSKLFINMTEAVQNQQARGAASNQNQIQLEQIIPAEFQAIESQYYSHYIGQIMDQQQQIGSQFKYETVYENIRKKVAKQNPSLAILPKKWRIDLPENKQVYFFVTYEHLFAKYEEKSTVVKLFGFWKTYAEFYALRNWEFKFICTFLEG